MGYVSKSLNICCLVQSRVLVDLPKGNYYYKITNLIWYRIEGITDSNLDLDFDD